MNNIRCFKLGDARHLVRMIGAEWDLAKRSTGAGRLCDWIYCAEILAVNTDMLVLTANDGRPIGFAGYSQKNARRHAFRRIFWRAVHFVLPLAVRNRGALREYYNVYNYAPAGIARQFDAECDILIVDKWHRGGAGRVLFMEMMHDAAARGVKRMRIDTDDSCSVGFYRAQGAREVYRATAANGGEEHSENVYVFSADLIKFRRAKKEISFS